MAYTNLVFDTNQDCESSKQKAPSNIGPRPSAPNYSGPRRFNSTEILPSLAARPETELSDRLRENSRVLIFATIITADDADFLVRVVARERTSGPVVTRTGVARAPWTLADLLGNMVGYGQQAAPRGAVNGVRPSAARASRPGHDQGRPPPARRRLRRGQVRPDRRVGRGLSQSTRPPNPQTWRRRGRDRGRHQHVRGAD